MADSQERPHQAGSGEEKKEPGALENIVSESLNAGKRAIALGAGAAAPFIFSGANRTNAMLNSYPLGIGAMVDDIMAKKPVDTVKAAKESLVGTIITPPLASLFKYITIAKDYVTARAGDLPGGAAAVGALAAAQAVFVGAYTGLNHIVQNFSFKGLYEKLKKEYWPTLRNTWKYVLPFSMWNVLYIYKFGIAAQMAYSSLMSFLFRLVGPKSEGASLGNLFRAANPFPIVSTTYSLGVKSVKNSFSSLYQGAYGLGAAISSMLTSLTPKSGPAAPKPAEPE